MPSPNIFCKECGARAGQPCHGKHGQVLVGIHRERTKKQSFLARPLVTGNTPTKLLEMRYATTEDWNR